ncbi:aa3-type cytochrome c oxidase subunit IV [Sphingomonas quercus]|uniref:Aa3-type cytochrome c oxidase subunit IV n=1 Tax=Sphingomonas quercus TaxID=2842451 RepID=A0ABS6BDV3_9SPHN|nr:aa3-type cytochrome c oxidase subunit IV [Sphingomonas quercus]MBU3076500.1 aa3-type cytochrome c oxidase subunit IV [Sphingomonas quercus]
MVAEHDSGFELSAHEGTYSGFTALMKWGTIISFICAAVVVLIIAS